MDVPQALVHAGLQAQAGRNVLFVAGSPEGALGAARWLWYVLQGPQLDDPSIDTEAEGIAQQLGYPQARRHDTAALLGENTPTLLWVNAQWILFVHVEQTLNVRGGASNTQLVYWPSTDLVYVVYPYDQWTQIMPLPQIPWREPHLRPQVSTVYQRLKTRNS